MMIYSTVDAENSAGGDLTENLALKTDSYKINHWNMYPKGTTKVYSYYESRKGAKYDYTPFFGLQYILMRHFTGKRINRFDIDMAGQLMKWHFGTDAYFNRDGWNHILNEHGGRLPVRIRAVPEGTLVPTGNVMMTIENTCDKCAWVTNSMETLLCHVWYPSTVAAKSLFIKRMLDRYLELTSDSKAGLPFMLHDFGYRGATCNESAGIGGMAHLMNFVGTDTIAAMTHAIKYYNANPETLAYSVAATEHSVMTAYGPVGGEERIVEELLDKYPSGILSVVSDSYNIENFINNIVGKKFRDRILARTGSGPLPHGVFVTRPDSKRDAEDTPEKQMVELAKMHWENFGGTTNSKGYKVIDPHVRLLWGDGIDDDGIGKILINMIMAGFSVENIATFGMGGGLLQKVNRDTQRFAFKSSHQIRYGLGYDIFKKPMDESKVSKKGRLKLVDKNGILITVHELEPGKDILETVFENGELVKTYTFDEVRKNTQKGV